MEGEKSNGALVGSIIIIIILIIGGIYLWKTSLNKGSDSVDQIPLSEEEADVAAELETELNSLDLESLDEGI